MLSLAAFYNRALDENISIAIYSSLVAFIMGLSGTPQAQLLLPEDPFRRGAALRQEAPSARRRAGGLGDARSVTLCSRLPP